MNQENPPHVEKMIDPRLTEYRENRAPITLLYMFYEGDVLRMEEFDFQGARIYGMPIPHGEAKSTEWIQENLLHQNDFFEFSFVKAGNLQMMVERGTCEHRAGDVFVFNRKIRHAEMSPYEGAYLSLSPEFIKEWPNEIVPLFKHKGLLERFVRKNLDDDLTQKKDYIDCRFVGTPSDFAQIANLFLRMRQEFLQRHRGSQLIVMGLIANLFSLLENKDVYALTYINLSSDNEFILTETILRQITKSNGQITAKQLSDMTHYNTDYLNRVFKNFTGMTIKKYCTTYRLKEFCRLLTQSDESISTLIEKMGFTNKTALYKTFYDHYGKSPQEYRDSPL